MLRLIIALIIIFVILYFQHDHINKKETSFEILQYDNPNKKIFENILYNKLISVFINIPINNKIIVNFRDLNNQKYIENKQKLDSYIQESFSYYNIPLCVYTKYNVNFNNTKNNIIKQKNYRELIYQYSGTKKLYVFSPDQEKYLYFDKKKNISNVNFYNQNINLFPLIKDAKYIEIILNPTQMIFIPPNWFYASESYNNSISFHITSDSFFSKLLLK